MLLEPSDPIKSLKKSYIVKSIETNAHNGSTFT